MIDRYPSLVINAPGVVAGRSHAPFHPLRNEDGRTLEAPCDPKAQHAAVRLGLREVKGLKQREAQKVMAARFQRTISSSGFCASASRPRSTT